MEAEDNIHPLPKPSAEPSGQGPVHRNQVYIVDDDPMVRRSLSFALISAGFEVRAFVSGRDFLDEVDLLASGCVLLDIRMPAMDGIAVLDELGDRIRRFSVVAMTGHGDVDIAVRAMKGGSTDFLEKPFSHAALLETLNALFLTLPARAEADAERVHAATRAAALTPREREVLQGLVAGLSNKGIANRLDVSVRTIEMHRGNLMECLGADSLAEVVRLAILLGVKPL